MADEEYFAELSMIGPEDGLLVATVENTGTDALPAGWVSVSASVTPAGTSDAYALAAMANEEAVPPGAWANVGRWSLDGWGDGAHLMSASMVVTDADAAQKALDGWEGVEFSVVGGKAVEYREDMLSSEELGSEFSTGAATFDVGWDPVPYLSDGQLVVTIKNVGTATLPAGAAVSFHIGEHETIGGLDRAVPAGDSWSATFDLPELPEGNHSADIAVYLTGGEIFEAADRDAESANWQGTNTIVDVCYQEDGPVEVLLH